MKYSALFKILSGSQHSVFGAQSEQWNRTRGIRSLSLSEDVSRLTEGSRAASFCSIIYIPVLSGGSGNDFGRRIVELSIVIVVEHAGVEQFLLPNGNQDLISKAVLERVQER